LPFGELQGVGCRQRDIRLSAVCREMRQQVWMHQHSKAIID
jgi:hypothetical protein